MTTTKYEPKIKIIAFFLISVALYWDDQHGAMINMCMLILIDDLLNRRTT